MAEKRTSKRLARPAAKRRATKKAAAPEAEPLNGEDTLAEANAAEEEAPAPKRRKRASPETESADATPPDDVPDPALRGQLMHELDALIKRLRSVNPGYNPPPFSPGKLLELVQENVDKLPPEMGLGILTKLRKTIGEDLFDVDTWKGMWYMLNYTVEYQGDVIKRRVTGEYETDEWGLDREVLDAVLPFFEFMYQKYWRVSLSGVENVPEEGRALLVSNHSGQLPWDGSMLATGMMLEHPNKRLVRTLYATWFPTLPILSDILVKCGQVLATDENGTRLLENDELVAVYPEGYKGVGKLYKDRYNLARFGRGGFVRMALKTRAPIIPVAIVGAEETYISLAKSSVMAKLIGFPYFPISPTFPWLGLLGFVPLPTKWYIDIGAPIPVDHYKANAENNVMLVSQLTDQVRNVVQKMIYDRLEQRRSVFFG
jgi:1-acyl-sn-glycerol-3-phosphate acyltransferase